jgi:hypothetical protein
MLRHAGLICFRAGLAQRCLNGRNRMLIILITGRQQRGERRMQRGVYYGHK